jgi:molybdenum cofactor guanylyltransferase
VNTSVAILAGGRSRRMGADKAWIKVDGTPLLERVLRAVRPLDLPVHIIANSDQDYSSFGVPVLHDSHPDQGPLGGLYTALTGTSQDALLLLACDLPFLDTAFLAFLLEQAHLEFAQSHPALAPRDAHGPQPLCAVYHRSLLPAVAGALTAKRLSLRALLRQANAAYLDPPAWERFDPQGRLLANLNTPEEYDRVQAQNDET